MAESVPRYVIRYLPGPLPRDCEHGRLARTCEMCEMQAEIAELRAENAALREAGEAMWVCATPGARARWRAALSDTPPDAPEVD